MGHCKCVGERNVSVSYAVTHNYDLLHMALAQSYMIFVIIMTPCIWLCGVVVLLSGALWVGHCKCSGERNVSVSY